MSDFDQILRATLTSVALISGVGLLLLSMVNRFNHALDRTRIAATSKHFPFVAFQRVLKPVARPIDGGIEVTRPPRSRPLSSCTLDRSSSLRPLPSD
jgi:hypothetical protein